MSKKKESDVIIGVFEYLRKTNRPYSANDILNNLKKEHGKTAITKALETLAADRKIMEKTYGKQKVYVMIQDGETYTNDQLSEMDTEIDILKENLAKLNQELKILNDEISHFKNKMSVDELKTAIIELTEKNEENDKLLDSLKNNPITVTKEERTKINQNYIYMKESYLKRKKLFMEIFNSLIENAGKNKAEFYEELGVETDENCDFKLKYF